MVEGKLDPIKSVRYCVFILITSILTHASIGTFLQLRWNHPVYGVSVS